MESQRFGLFCTRTPSRGELYPFLKSKKILSLKLASWQKLHWQCSTCYGFGTNKVTLYFTLLLLLLKRKTTPYRVEINSRWCSRVKITKTWYKNAHEKTY